MSLHKLVAATAAGVLAVAVSAGVVAEAAAGRPARLSPAARQEPKPKPPTDRDLLHGDWLFDAATDEHGNDALNGPYREARLTFNKDQVAITQSPVSAAPVGTTYTIDPTANPKRMDWEVPALYRTLLRIPAGTARGLYKFEDADTTPAPLSYRPPTGAS